MGFDRYKKYYRNAVYHIYNRGIDGQDIFKDKQDYIVYMKAMRKYRDKFKVTMLCYCLMPNHIHLLARQGSDKPIYKFIQSLHTSYAIYFNRKYVRKGTLWQDRFKQRNVNNEGDMLYLSFYIHLNPLSDGLVDNLADYRWSSYLDFIGARNGTLCDKLIILQEFSGADYRRLLMDTKDIISDRKMFRKYLENLNFKNRNNAFLIY